MVSPPLGRSLLGSSLVWWGASTSSEQVERGSGSIFLVRLCRRLRNAIRPRGISLVAGTLADGERRRRGVAYHASRSSLVLGKIPGDPSRVKVPGY